VYVNLISYFNLVHENDVTWRWLYKDVK